MNLFSATLQPTASPTPISQRVSWPVLAIALSCIYGLALAAAIFGFNPLALNAHGHTHLHANGLPFVDARTIWGIANCMDVLSNLPFAFMGVWGLWCLRVAAPRLTATQAIAGKVFFLGLVCTAFSSSYYHLAPDAFGLMWDRLGISVAFAGVLALAVGECAGQGASIRALCAVGVAAPLGAVLAYSHGNVMPWAVVQFGGMLVVAWAACQRPAHQAMSIRLGLLVGIYAAAKVLEMSDEWVFSATNSLVSGHSLKHMAAACAALPVLLALHGTGKAQSA